MSSTLPPASPRTGAVRGSEGSNNSLWIGLLLLFVFLGFWLWMPMMEAQVGAARVDPNRPKQSGPVEQNLEATAVDSGPNLSMESAVSKPRKSVVESGLYQAPATKKP